MNNRNQTIDVLKGIMILAVILGHIAGTISDSPHNNVIFLLCYSWHMFCFMMTVGYIAAQYGHIENNKAKLLMRAKRLLVPYFVWTILRAISLGHYDVLQVFKDMFVTPLYWFLLVQFIYEVIVFICGKSKNKIMIIIFSALMFGGIYVVTKTELFRQTIQYFPYYFIGYFGGRARQSEKFILHFKRIIPLIAIFYPLSMYFYAFKDKCIVAERLNNFLVSLNIVGGAREKIVYYAYHGGFQLYNYVIVAMLGSAFYLCIAYIIDLYGGYLRLILSKLGKYTLQYYVLSAFGYVTIFSKSINWMLSLILCLLLPFVCIYLTKQRSKLNKIMFGS